MLKHTSLLDAALSACIAIPAVACLVQPPDSTAQPGRNNTTQPERRMDPDRDGSRDAMKQDQGKRPGSMNDQPGEMHGWLKQFAGTWNITVESYKGAANNDPSNMNDPNRKDADKSDLNRSNPDASRPSDSTRRAGLPDKDSGVATTKMVLDDRYAQMMVQCNKTTDHADPATGKRKALNFEGMQLIGYNSETGRFESVWTDNHCTHVTVLTGELDSARKTLTLTNDNVKIGDRLDSTTSSSTPANTANAAYSGKGSVRQVIRWNGPSSFVTEIYKGGDSSSPEKQMVITFTKADSGISAPTAP